MEMLKEFMLLFRFEPGNEQPTPAQEQEMHKQWGNFIETIAMQGKLVSTYQLGFEGKQIHTDQTTTMGMRISENETIGGNLILKAENMDEAVELSRKCPILLMGGSVEVRDIIPMH